MSCCYHSLPLMCCFLSREAALPSRVLTWEAAALLGPRAAAHALLSTCLNAREGAASYQASQLRGHRAFQKLRSLWAEQPVVGINAVSASNL